MRMVIAGGGTGGHLFPGIAVAEEFLKRDGQNRVLFIGTRRGIEYRILPGLGYALELIEVEGLKGRGVKALAKAMVMIPRSLWHSRRILQSFAPDVVLGVGGYASGPAVLAARLMGLPTAVAEQNALAGNTNRLLGKVVDKVFLTYAQSKKGFAAAKVMVTGNPVRAAFAEGLADRRSSSGIRQILIFGGSQGAAAINATVVAMLPLLEKMKDALHIVHQTGERDLAAVKEAYRRHGVNALVSPFIADMVSAYAASDLMICRAGATSLAEITAAGRASILIPFPFAANDHQTQNARAMVESGAAIMISERDLTPEKLFAEIEALLTDEKKLQEMEARSKKMGRLDAARQIVDACMTLAVKKT